MPVVYDDECAAAGVCPDEVRRIAARIECAAKDAKKLGLLVFGGSGGTLRAMSTARTSCEGDLIVSAMVGGAWSGGDGAYGPDDEGLNRGE